MQVMSQQLGTQLTREQAAAFGVDQQVLAQLVAGAVLDEQARKLGLGVSKDRLAQLAREDPAFRGPDGKFDRQQFDAILREVGMRPRTICSNREQVAVRQQIVEAISDGLRCAGRVPARRSRSIAARTARSTTWPCRARWSSRSRSPASAR